MTDSSDTNTSIEQVRDLLMGTQLKDLEQRCVRQEERFRRELSDLRESMKTRFDSLENFMRSEISTLLHRLQEEQGERAAVQKTEQQERVELIEQEKRERNEAVLQVTRNVAVAEESFERKLTGLSGTLDTVERDLRQLLLTENGRLSNKIDEKHKDAIGALSVISTQIRNDMATRSVLSNLLSEMAIKLAQWQGNDIFVNLEEEAPHQIGQNDGDGHPG